MEPHNPRIEEIMHTFTYDHLPEYLQAVSRPFCELAQQLHESLPHDSVFTEFALMTLSAAKDAAVKAVVN